MSRRIVAGNWKMHGSTQFVADYAAALDGSVQKLAEQAPAPGFVLFPPVGYLPLLRENLAAWKLQDLVGLGAQNLHEQVEGAYTGEMSAEMLADLGADWVLVGHSERREYAGETNALVANKVAAALRGGLRPMLCFGETEAERDSGRADEVVAEQLKAVLAVCTGAELATGAVAYEPVWAIGTGKTATPAMAQEMHGLIRRILADNDGQAAAATPILYGGSVKPANAGALFDEADIDGGLVGGASLVATDLVEIASRLS